MNDTPVSGKNRHPVDELADIRAQIKTLKAREDELKTLISDQMGSRDSLGGDEFIAHQKLTTRKGGIDDKAMKAAGIEVDKFRKPETTVMTITVEPRVSEAA